MSYSDVVKSVSILTKTKSEYIHSEFESKSTNFHVKVSVYNADINEMSLQCSQFYIFIALLFCLQTMLM